MVWPADSLVGSGMVDDTGSQFRTRGVGPSYTETVRVENGALTLEFKILAGGASRFPPPGKRNQKLCLTTSANRYTAQPDGRSNVCPGGCLPFQEDGRRGGKEDPRGGLPVELEGEGS